MTLFRCDHCGAKAEKPSGHVNRSRRQGMSLYCSKRCFGLAHRKNRSDAEKREMKRTYDVEYRAANLARIKRRKSAYHRATYDPEKAAVERKKRAPQHLEYCRRPEYRKWKQDYDQKHLALKTYGEFNEAYLALRSLDRHIKERVTDYEKRIENGTICKVQKRRREDGAPDRGRRRHKAAHGA